MVFFVEKVGGNCVVCLEGESGVIEFNYGIRGKSSGFVLGDLEFRNKM